MSSAANRVASKTAIKTGGKSGKKSFGKSESKNGLAAKKAIQDQSFGGDRGLTAFGERLVATLQSKGMSDSELAKALGIAQPNIHTLKYKTDRPRHKTVSKIAKVLGVTAEALLPQSPIFNAMTTAAEGTKVYLIIENQQGRQTIRLA